MEGSVNPVNLVLDFYPQGFEEGPRIATGGTSNGSAGTSNDYPFNLNMHSRSMQAKCIIYPPHLLASYSLIPGSSGGPMQVLKQILTNKCIIFVVTV